jgi:CHAT domain-containing protein/tetratricopeptide (TPR) repeat protein
MSPPLARPVAPAALAVLLVASLAAAPFAAEPDANTRIADLRVEGRYAEAAALAGEEAARVDANPAAESWERDDARWRAGSLARIAAMPESTRAVLQGADRLERELEESVSANEAGGGARAEEWIALLEGVFGAHCREMLDPHRAAGGYDYFDMDLAASERHFRIALELARAFLPPGHPAVAEALSNLSIPAVLSGDLARGEVLLREALRDLRRLSERHLELELGVTNNLASVLERRGDDLAATEFARATMELARETRVDGLPPHVHPGHLNRLARILRRQGDLDEAERLLHEAIALHDLPEMANPSWDLGVAYLVLGDVYADRGDYAAAVESQERALAICRTMKGERHPDAGRYLATIASTLLRAGRTGEAEPRAREAVGIHRATVGESHPFTCGSLRTLGLVLEARGRLAEAESTLAEAAASFDVARLGIVDADRALLPLPSPYPDLARVRMERGETDAAWVATERALGRTLADLLDAAGRRGGSGAFAARHDSVASALGGLERAVAALDERAAAGEGATTGADALALRRELAEAEAAWAALRVEEGAGVAAPAEPFPLPRIRAALDPRTAIVGWMEGRGGAPGWGYVIRNAGPVRWAPIPAGPGAAAALRRTLDDAAAWPARVPLTPDVTARAAALWNERIAPLLPFLDGVDALEVIPSGSMLGVPLEAARAPNGSWAGDRFAISYAPSATVTALLAARPAPPGGDRVRALLVGDPPFGPGGEVAPADVALLWRSAVAGNADALDRLPPLPASRDEVLRLAEMMPGARVLLGRDASEATLAGLAASGELRSFRVLHFASHALVDDRAPGRSAIVLSRQDLPDPVEAALAGRRATDGLLTAREIVREWRLDADLVALSGCRTGLGKEAPGEGYLGLAHALLQVGARSVLVSLWPVEDRAAAILMESFYAAALSGGTGALHDIPEALRRAKRELRAFRDPDGSRPFEHPVYWSPFILVGNFR